VARGPGEARQGAGRGRAGEDPQRQRRGVDLHVPGPPGRRPEVEGARRAAVGQHAVAAARQQPGHGVVRRVVARAEAPGRDRGRGHRPAGGAERAVGDVALHVPPAVVDGVGALTEPVVALPGGRGERRAQGAGLGRAGAGGCRGRPDGDRAVARGGHDHGEAAPPGVVRGDPQAQRAPVAAAGQHARGRRPARGRPEGEPGQVQRGAAALGERDAERARARMRRQRPGGDLRGAGRGHGGRAGRAGRAGRERGGERERPRQAAAHASPRPGGAAAGRAGSRRSAQAASSSARR
jgi:hypothetical protein